MNQPTFSGKVSQNNPPGNFEGLGLKPLIWRKNGRGEWARYDEATVPLQSPSLSGLLACARRGTYRANKAMAFLSSSLSDWS